MDSSQGCCSCSGSDSWSRTPAWRSNISATGSAGGGALLTWPGPKPPYYAMALAIGVVLGLLVMVKLYRGLPIFGEAMMFLYYAYLFPLSRSIGRGFYEDGIWADTVFIPYNEVGGISWREGEHSVSLIIISRLRNLARRLSVPGDNTARRGGCSATRSASTRSTSPARPRPRRARRARAKSIDGQVEAVAD